MHWTAEADALVAPILEKALPDLRILLQDPDRCIVASRFDLPGYSDSYNTYLECAIGSALMDAANVPASVTIVKRDDGHIIVMLTAGVIPRQLRGL